MQIKETKRKIIIKIMAAVYYSPPPSPLTPPPGIFCFSPLIDAETSDNQWLKSAAEKHIKGDPEDDRSLDTITFACMIQSGREKGWKLSDHFPNRTVTTNEVQSLTIDELMALPSADYFAVVDLLSLGQVLCILKSNDPDLQERQAAIYYFNQPFADYLRTRLKALRETDLISEVRRKKGSQLLEKLVTYSSDELDHLMGSKSWPIFQDARVNPSLSITLSWKNFVEHFSRLSKATSQAFKHLSAEEISQLADADLRAKLGKRPFGMSDTLWNQIISHQTSRQQWMQIDKESLLKPLPVPLTVDFLTERNAFFRMGYKGGIRNAESQIFCGRSKYTSQFFLPGIAVKEEFDLFLEWLNRQIEICDKDPIEYNPIFLAGAVYDSLVMIHPFHDGNGRTARFLADSILRRYGLLPGFWEPIDITDLGFPAIRELSHSRALDAVKNSYLSFGAVFHARSDSEES